MPVINLDRKTIDELHRKFAPALKGDPTQVDPSSDTMAEFGALLHAVNNSGDRFRFISLGAAPGEWVWRAERLHRFIYPSGDYKSICVEGDLDHVGMMQKYFVDNNASTTANHIRHVAVSAKDGWAYFPIINPDKDWGSGIAAWSENANDLDQNITITEQSKATRIAANDGKPLEFRTVEAVSLSTLVKQDGPIDLIHCDIQGAEGDVFPENMQVLSKSVRICCIETHGREIESRLISTFSSHGWNLEAAYTCKINDSHILLRDGTLVWSNPNIEP